MKPLPHNRKKGFSVIEILVYLAIFSVMSITVINSFLVVTRSFTSTRINRDLLESGQSALDRMAYEIRRAQSVDTSGSTFGSNPGVLSLASTDSLGAPETIGFVIESGVLVLYTNGVRTGPITDTNVSVDSLVFRRVVTGHGEAVKIEMILRSTAKKTPMTANFYDTIVVRGEY